MENQTIHTSIPEPTLLDQLMFENLLNIESEIDTFSKAKHSSMMRWFNDQPQQSVENLKFSILNNANEFLIESYDPEVLKILDKMYDYLSGHPHPLVTKAIFNVLATQYLEHARCVTQLLDMAVESLRESVDRYGLKAVQQYENAGFIEKVGRSGNGKPPHESFFYIRDNFQNLRKSMVNHLVWQLDAEHNKNYIANILDGFRLSLPPIQRRDVMSLIYDGINREPQGLSEAVFSPDKAVDSSIFNKVPPPFKEAVQTHIAQKPAILQTFKDGVNVSMILENVSVSELLKDSITKVDTEVIRDIIDQTLMSVGHEETTQSLIAFYTETFQFGKLDHSILSDQADNFLRALIEYDKANPDNGQVMHSVVTTLADQVKQLEARDNESDYGFQQLFMNINKRLEQLTSVSENIKNKLQKFEQTGGWAIILETTINDFNKVARKKGWLSVSDVPQFWIESQTAILADKMSSEKIADKFREKDIFNNML